MSISDWSSDVCSSDLLKGFGFFGKCSGADAGAGNHNIDRTALKEVACSGMQSCAVADIGHIDFMLARKAIAHCLQGVQAPPQQGHLVAAPRIKQGDAGASAATRPRDEHTFHRTDVVSSTGRSE